MMENNGQDSLSGNARTLDQWVRLRSRAVNALHGSTLGIQHLLPIESANIFQQ
jgi:hypothetical protein